MIKKAVIASVFVAVLSVPLAGHAAADDPAPKPNPLSASGLCHCNVPKLSAPGLLNGGHDYAVPPLSAKGIAVWLNGVLISH